MSLIGTDIQLAAKYLRHSDVIGLPTETVYGLAGNAFDSEAVARIFAVKNRPTFDPLIVHTSSPERLTHFVEDIPEQAQVLARQFWPGALTLLLPRKEIIPDLVTSGLDTVAVRIPNHPLTLQLLDSLDFPLAAPSANPFGYISPTRAEHVQAQLGGQVSYILDGGPCMIGIESTIIGFPEGKPTVFRLGGIALEVIEKSIGSVAVMPHSSSNPLAPGMLKSHYAPRKPLFISSPDKLLSQYKPEQIGYIGFTTPHPDLPPQNQCILSPTHSYTEAARNLFAALRKLDTLPVQIIAAELLPEKDLGRAINDRLRRAAAV